MIHNFTIRLFAICILASACAGWTAPSQAAPATTTSAVAVDNNSETDRAARARIAQLTSEIGKNPGEAKLYYERGQQWEKVSVVDAQGKTSIGDKQQARADYESALKLNPKYADARAILAWLQVSDALNQIQSSIAGATPGDVYVEPALVATLNQEFAQAQKDDPKNFSAFYYAGILNLGRLGGLSEHSIQVLGKPFVFKQLTLAWRQAATAQKNLGFGASVFKRFSTNSKTYLEELRKTATPDDWTRLQPILNSMTEALASDYAIWDLRAGYRFKFKDVAGAQADMERALQKASDEPAEQKATLHYKLAQIKLANKDEAGALGDLNSATQLNPKEAGPYLSRAKLHMSASRREAALDELNKGIEQATPTAGLYSARAIILRRMGRTSEADADEKKAAILK